jgi:hypothetical protein
MSAFSKMRKERISPKPEWPGCGQFHPGRQTCNSLPRSSLYGRAAARAPAGGSLQNLQQKPLTGVRPAAMYDIGFYITERG